MLASDDSNRDFAGARNPDDVLWVQFYTRATRNEAMSKLEGSAIFVDEIFVRIMIPGRNDLTIDRPLEPMDQHRFPRQWSQFKNAQEGAEQMVGTPVAEWPVITRAQAEELRSKRFYTVQQIAECSDAQIAALGMNANNLRLKARAFVATAKDSALAQKQAEELKQRDDEIAGLKDQMAKMMSMIENGVAAAPARGRPKKKAKREMSEEQKEAARARAKAYWEGKKARTLVPAES